MAASAQVLPFPRPPSRTTDVPGFTGTADVPANIGAVQAGGEPGERDPKLLSVTRLKKQLNDYLSSKHAENEEAQEADRYFHSSQWTDHERKVLADRNQPVVTYNRIKRKINTIVGIIERARQDPKAFPRNPNQGAEDGAEICTKALNYALGWDWQDKSAEVARRCSVRGIWGVELVLVAGDNGDPDTELDEVDQRDFFYDPRSGKRDFSDAKYQGTTRWIDTEEAEDSWPDKVEELKGLRENAPGNWEKDDTRNLSWYNRSEDQVRIVDHWYKRGQQWYYTIYCGDVILEEGPSPFFDEKRRSICKYIMMSCEVDHDNDRYGFFRDLKGPQDEINHRRSKGLHALNSRRIIADAGAVDDVDLARREAVRSDGYLVKNKGYDLQIVENTNDVAGNLEMLTEAKNEIDNYGPNPSLIGTTIDAASGRAIQLLQAAGIAELGTFMLTYKTWKLRVYRALWACCQQFWTSERWIRVTDQEGMAEFIQVNGWETDEWGYPVVINQLAQLDVDIILDEGPDTVNTMSDTFDTVLALANAGQQIPPEIIIELSALPSSVKKRVMQQLADAKQPNPMDQQALQLKLEEIMAGIQQKQSTATLNYAKAATEGMGPDGQAPQQVDTPADLAKARLDMAKAAEIETRINTPNPDRGLFDVEEQAARVRQTNAQASETEIKARLLAQYGTQEPARIQQQAQAAANRPARPPSARQ